MYHRAFSVDYYEVRYASSPFALGNNTFKDQTMVSNDPSDNVHIIKGNLSNPQPAGATENIDIQVKMDKCKYTMAFLEMLLSVEQFSVAYLL